MSQQIRSMADLEAAIIHHRGVGIASLACLRALRKQIESNASKSQILRTLDTEIKEIENLNRTGHRNPENTLAVRIW